MLQHLALFHGEALPAHALALLQNAFECSHELIGDNVRWPLARVLALSRANQLRIMQVIIAAVYIIYCIFHRSLQVKMIFAAQPLMQVVGAVTCLASLLQHAETDCCSVLCDAYPRMQVILVLKFFLLRIGHFTVSFLSQQEARSSLLWALIHGLRSGRMKGISVELILAAIARSHAMAAGMSASQQWFVQRCEASFTVITVPVLRYLQAGLLPAELALLIHRELPSDLSNVRLNCTLPALMIQQQQLEQRVMEFGTLCGYASEMLVCLALLHARDTQQFSAACLHQAYFTFGSALKSALPSSSPSSTASSSSFFSIYSRFKGGGGVLREGQGGGVMCADDVVGLYSMQLQV